MRSHPRLLMASLFLFAFLSICRATQNIRQSEQRQITLYHANRNFLLDCFDGQTRFTFSDSITGRQEKFAAQAHRWAHGIRTGMTVNSDTFFSAPNLYVRAPFVQFYGKTLVIVDDKRWIQPSVRAPVGIEVLVLRNNVRLRLGDCLRQFPARLVVFEASNSRGRVERWKAECKSLNIPFHDVREQGAWVQPF